MKKSLKDLAVDIKEKATKEISGFREESFSSQYETKSGILIDYNVTCTITEDNGYEEDGYCGSLQIENLFIECEMLVNQNCINMPNVTSEINHNLFKLNINN